MSWPAAEVLEATPSRGWLSRRLPSRRWSRRTVVIVALAAVVLATTAYAVDRRARADEERALAACGARASEAVRTAYRPLRELWGRALPALDGGASLMIRFSLYRLISDSAVGAADGVVAARRDCAEVGIRVIHRDLLTRRDDCLRALDRHVDFLERVARSGVTVNSAWPEALAGC